MLLEMGIVRSESRIAGRETVLWVSLARLAVVSGVICSGVADSWLSSGSHPCHGSVGHTSRRVSIPKTYSAIAMALRRRSGPQHHSEIAATLFGGDSHSSCSVGMCLKASCMKPLL